MAEETALVKVNPLSDALVASLRTQALELQYAADHLVIASNDDVTSATTDLSVIANVKKAIEDKRKEYTQPLNNYLKAINDAFKTFTEPVLYADKLMRRKILDYRAEIDRQRREAAEIERMKREAAEREAALTGQPIIQPEPTPAIARAPDRYHADKGMMGKAVIWKFEVIDFALVPDEYKIVDATKVGKVVRAGLRSIPGIRIYPEETLRVTAL